MRPCCRARASTGPSRAFRKTGIVPKIRRRPIVNVCHAGMVSTSRRMRGNFVRIGGDIDMQGGELVVRGTKHER